MGGSNSTEIHGLRVFKVSPGSPAEEAGLEVFFDFISELNGTKMDPSGQGQFANIIAASENGKAKLQVFNTRMNAVREVIINPRKWGGSGLLGATVRYDVVDPAENHGLRVLEVFPNSPAAHAGLMPFQDYMLGTPQSVFHDIDELAEHLSTNVNKRLQIYVYNASDEKTREVTMVPNSDWGGDGCIGCDIGSGLLHRIPVPRIRFSPQLGGTQMASQQMGLGAAALPEAQPTLPMQVQTAISPQNAAPIPLQPVAPLQAIHPATMQSVLIPGSDQMAPLGITAPGSMPPVYPGSQPFSMQPATSTPYATSNSHLHAVAPPDSANLVPQVPAPFIPSPLVPATSDALNIMAPVPMTVAAPPVVAPQVPAPVIPSLTAPSEAAPVSAPLAATLLTPSMASPQIPAPTPPAPLGVGPGLSPSEELAALQARIQQLGSTMTVPVPAAPATTTSAA